jgi:regulator of replication initiation timing
MNDAAETAAARLWRDRAQIRERERDEARAQARITAQKLEILTAENDRLSTENARLRAKINPDALRARAETEMQMEAVRCALEPLLLS